MASVIVLAGGTSSERDVSLRTGAAVAQALRESGHTVQTLDPTTDLSKENLQCDVVFPALHGKGGEDGDLQQRLENFGVRYVGSGIEASRLCFDKQAYRETLIGNAIAVAAGGLVNEVAFWASVLVQGGYVLKPNDGGSSIDTVLRRSGEPQLSREQITDIFSRHEQMLLEQLIEGAEITIAVFDGTVMPVIEIVPPDSGWFDYENKYNGATQELCPAVNVAPEVQRAAQDLAIKIDQLCGCRDMSRTDMIVDATDKLWVLETNTIPGMTDRSLLPVAIAAVGLSYSEMVDRLVQAALRR